MPVLLTAGRHAGARAASSRGCDSALQPCTRVASRTRHRPATTFPGPLVHLLPVLFHVGVALLVGTHRLHAVAMLGALLLGHHRPARRDISTPAHSGSLPRPRPGPWATRSGSRSGTGRGHVGTGRCPLIAGCGRVAAARSALCQRRTGHKGRCGNDHCHSIPCHGEPPSSLWAVRGKLRAASGALVGAKARAACSSYL